MAGISAIQRLLDNQLTSKFARSLNHSDLPEGWADNPEIVALAEDAYREAGTESPFFKAWFGNSKVVDEAGEPLKGYHGSAAEFDVFRPSKTGNLGPAIYTSPDREAAEEFAKTHDGANIYELFINSENPLTLSNSLEASEEFWGKLAGKTEADAIADLHKQGYDGAWAVGRGESRWGNTAPEIAVYSPYQLKSTSNRGTFNPADPNIYKGLIPAVGAGGLLSLIGAEEAEAAQRGGASSEFWPAMARQFGLGTRGVIEGLGTGATLGFGDPGRWVADAIGLPSPETDIERQRVGLNAGVTDALTTFAGGVGAAKMAANPVVRGVGMELADKPLLGAGIGGLLGLLGYDYEEE